MPALSGSYDLEATPLVAVEEMVEALQKANDFAYVAPGTDSG